MGCVDKAEWGVLQSYALDMLKEARQFVKSVLDWIFVRRGPLLEFSLFVG